MLSNNDVFMTLAKTRKLMPQLRPRSAKGSSTQI